MKVLIVLSIMVLLASCKSSSDNYYFNTDVIEIKSYTLPDSAKLLDTVKIAVHSEEPNGCWSNLNFVLSQTSDTIYRLKAFGTFETFTGVCEQTIVSKDTVINFIPVRKCKYLFYITQPTFATIDTMLVD